MVPTRFSDHRDCWHRPGFWRRKSPLAHASFAAAAVATAMTTTNEDGDDGRQTAGSASAAAQLHTFGAKIQLMQLSSRL